MIPRRQTIQVPGRDRLHSPVPEGIRAEEFIFSSLLGPVGPNREEGSDALEDAELLFGRIRGLVEAGGELLPILLLWLSMYLMTTTVRPSIRHGSRCFRIPRIVLPAIF